MSVGAYDQAIQRHAVLHCVLIMKLNVCVPAHRSSDNTGWAGVHNLQTSAEEEDQDVGGSMDIYGFQVGHTCRVRLVA